MEKPISKIAVILSPQEAVVIAKLREFDYGDMTIKKKDGNPYQIVVSKSTIVTYEEGLNLKDGLALPKGSELAKKEVVSLDDIAKLFIKG
jgi:hypothetical protein